jgi:hypothetical protein
MQFASRTDRFIVSSRAAKIEENNIYSASASGYATVFFGKPFTAQSPA